MVDHVAPGRALASLVALGAGVGAVVLGLGGRLAMRLIALLTGTPASLSVEGTFTVIGAGALNGAAGAVLYLASHAIAGRFGPRGGWVGHPLFAMLLALVTLRGLHGAPPGPSALFIPLVAVYGVAFSRLAARRRAWRPREGRTEPVVTSGA